MGKSGRPLFDLNELPAEEEDAMDSVQFFQPQKTLPNTNFHTANLFPLSDSGQQIINNHAFTHASSVSGFQPFIRTKDKQNLKDCSKSEAGVPNTNEVLSPMPMVNSEDVKVAQVLPIQPDVPSVEREEGEWTRIEGNDNADLTGSNDNDSPEGVGSEIAQKKIEEEEEVHMEAEEHEPGSVNSAGSNYHDSALHGNGNKEAEDSSKDMPNHIQLGLGSSRNSDCCNKGDAPAGIFPEPSSVVKPRDVKGVEASHALKSANNPLKRPKLDEHKEAMLGKKRARQTMFINVEDAKLAGSMKNSTPRRQSSFLVPIVTRTIKDTNRPSSAMNERHTERQSECIFKDQKKFDMEGNVLAESSDQNCESNGYSNPGPEVRSKKMSNNELPGEVPTQVPRQSSWKQPLDSRQFKNPPISSRKLTVVGQNTDPKMGNKKHLPSKKQSSNNLLFQDTSVERMLREVTNDKFWRHPEETELQCVPGHFESVEEYIRVFEPLLFEECRAQLYSTWEELTEPASRDAHIMVHVKTVERRERGWYDVIVLAVHECKWSFKEGDVAILSSPRPGAAKSSRRNATASSNEEDVEPEVTGRVAGTVRRHIPIDTRDPRGAILHFYVGESYDSSSKMDDHHTLKKFQPKSIWYLTVLGSLATTQREYVALHAFRRLNLQVTHYILFRMNWYDRCLSTYMYSVDGAHEELFPLQMQSAILKPSPEHFPKYEEQPPAMPECFTQNFVDYLRKTFNGPQLAAIQWAAMHTAAGTSSGVTKKQDPWPFTLVQGPPGTGKTHTVWGMLNVIHLVQYQHYYTGLLKKLAPESYKQTSESNFESVSMGSIDEVLHSMDQNLLRTLPKLCPKPRMLVCAPSNAATDELLARVLDRGFIDGEMKVYRPDVARVGVDTQTRAAQAVSVERRTEQLLLKGRDEVVGWMHQLKAREAHYSQQIAAFQRDLSVAAAAGRSQGSVGVDPDVLVARDHNRDVLLQNLAAAVEGRDKVLVEMSRLLILEGRFRAGSSFNMDDARANLEASFANEAEIVFTTVSSSGRKLFSRLTHGFDMVVIDEAAQASEVAVLPPLSLGATRCVLVGDPQQLPATVISKAAGTLLYSRSLFERFQQAGCPTMLLSVQYRMHPQIRDFPSRYFYQGRLTDSESVANLAPEVYYKDPILQPYMFYDIMHGRESHRGGSVSYQNIHEAQFSLRLYEHLQKFLKSNGGKKVSVGIITPYKLQLKCLQREFDEVLSSEEGKDIYINTVDAFQGQERDVIIMSCVRASNHGVGFVADIRRMNVALTRARRALWVVGNANALMQSDDWAALIADAKSRKCFMDMDSIPKEFLILKGSSYTPTKISSNSMRSLRTGGQRQRHLEMFAEPKPNTQSEDEEKLKIFPPRNGSYRNLKLIDSSLDDPGQFGDRPRDALQYGIAKRQNPGVGRREM